MPAILSWLANDPAAELVAVVPFPSLADFELIVVAVTNPFSILRLLTVDVLSACAEFWPIEPVVVFMTKPVDKTVHTPGLISTKTLAT
jgi:hypothetical protein